MQPSGLLRRLGAVFYDCLLLLAVLLLVTAPFVPFLPADQIPDGPLQPIPANRLHQLLLGLAVFGYFVGYWAWRGRTLGMQSWGLQLETPGRQVPGAGRCALRFFAALLSLSALGLGFVWQLWDRDRLTWHDRLSGTRLNHYPRRRQ